MSSSRFRPGQRLRFNTVRFRQERLVRVRRLMTQLEKIVAALGAEGWTDVDAMRLGRLEMEMRQVIDQRQHEDLDAALRQGATDATALPAADDCAA